MKKVTFTLAVMLISIQIFAIASPNNLVGEAGDSHVILNWDPPIIGGLMEISYHDGIQNDAYIQQFSKGYGTVFDISDLNANSLEKIDFRHSSYGINGPHSYKIHIVNWTNTAHEVMVVIDELETTVNDNWENDIPLNISLDDFPDVQQIGIFIEPLSNTSADAYPVIDFDAALSSPSYIINISDYSINDSAQGDFLIDLWVDIPESRAFKVSAIDPIKGLDSPKLEKNITRSSLGQFCDSTPDRDFIGYNVYRNNAVINDEPLIELSYVDLSVENGSIYEYKVTALFSEGESEPTDPVLMTPLSNYFFDSFEEYDDFSLEFGDWTLVDIDSSATWGINNVDFLHEEEPMSFIVFNPSATTPAMNGADPYHGEKFAACFASQNPPNNDLLISPAINIEEETTLSFRARSQTSQYGLERFIVGVSTSLSAIPEPTDFDIISPGDYLEAPVSWTKYEFSLSDYVGQTIYICVQCISHDAFIFMLDDFSIGGVVYGNDDNFIESQRNIQTSNFPNPFNPLTTISYNIPQSGKTTIDVYNLRGQKIASLLDDYKKSGIQHQVTWNGKNSEGKNVGNGIYFYQVKNGSFTATRKIILLK